MGRKDTDLSELDADELVEEINLRRRAHRLQLGGVALVAVTAVVASFMIGRTTAPDSVDAEAGACAQVDSDLRRMKGEAAAAGEGSTQAADIERTQLNIIVQQPDCFSADVRGRAQTALDRDDQRVAAQGECAASDQPWWECDG